MQSSNIVLFNRQDSTKMLQNNSSKRRRPRTRRSNRSVARCSHPSSSFLNVTLEFVFCTDRHHRRCKPFSWQPIDIRISRDGSNAAYRLRVSFGCVDRDFPKDAPGRFSEWNNVLDRYASILRVGGSLTLPGWAPWIRRPSCPPRLGDENGKDAQRLLDEFDEEFGDAPEEDEYEDDIASYMLQLEARCLPTYHPSIITNPRFLSRRLDAINLLDRICGAFQYSLETLWLSANLFDRYLSLNPASGIRRWRLLAAVCFLLAAKSNETRSPSVYDIRAMCRYEFEALEARAGELVVMKSLGYVLLAGYSPWFWLSGGSGGRLVTGVEDFLVQIAMRDAGMAMVRPSVVAAAVMRMTTKMGLRGGDQDTGLLWRRCEEKEVLSAYEKLVEGLRDQEALRRYQGESGSKASRFAVRWAKGGVLT